MTRFGYPTYSVSATKSGISSIPVSRNSTSCGASDTRTLVQRKVEKSKKWPLRAWDADDSADDGIVGWMKRHSTMENKKARKRPEILDAEFYIPTTHKCPTIDDLELFQKKSLHPVHQPKPKVVIESETSVKVKYTKGNIGIITPAGFEERVESDEPKEGVKSDIDTYRALKNPGSNLEKTPRDAMDHQARLQLERSNTYMKIKRLLKFSKNDRSRTKPEEEEDEGYSSKTSSAETKHAIESDGEEQDNRLSLLRPEMQRMYSSMVDLSELPSHSGYVGGGGLGSSMQDARVVEDGGRVKFSYTHQPTILQLPDPDVKLAHDSLRIEKRIESEDSNWSYAKLKRNKELNRCYQPEMLQPAEETTVYNIDSMKPVTMVLRKISIQNADNIQPTVSNWSRNTPEDAQTTLCNNLGLGSNPASRADSVNQKDSVVVSRPGSAVSGVSVSPVPGKGTPRNNTTLCNTSRTPPGQRKYGIGTRASSAMSQRELRHNTHRSNVRDVRVVNEGQTKEPMWSHDFSYINRQTLDGQATNYSIGDLLPAVDKNIYSSHPVMGKYGQQDNEAHREDTNTTEIMDMNKTNIEDGYILLKKGMDMLTGNTEKPTLGPPPFRPNQTRHPLMRNMTVIVSNKHGSETSSNPVGVSRTNGLKTSSDRGPRHVIDEDLQTQKKLKEAFSQFYRNRPKEIGKEFRRMQTMWKT